MLVFDKKEQYARLIENGFEKYPNKRDLVILCEMWCEQGVPDSELKNMMVGFCQQWNPKFNYAKSETLILNVLDFVLNTNCDKGVVYSFCTDIKIYKKEIAELEKIEDIKLQKFLFIMICLAKWRNADFIYLNSESTIKTKDICDLAGIKATKRERNTMLHTLDSIGAIDVQLKPLLKTFIPCIENSGEPVLRFTIGADMVNQWTTRTLPHCANCGCTFEKNNNKQKYCKECAKIIKNRQTCEIMQRKRMNDS